MPLDHQILISSMIQFHLKWWMDTNLFVTGVPVPPPEPNAFLFTNASHYGWGAHLEPVRLSFHGRWTEDQSQLHINMPEMIAIPFALEKAITFIHHSCVMISTDNTTVVSYIKRQCGTHSPNLCIEVWKILTWSMEHDILVRVRHIPGKFNILADRLSRLDKSIKTDWALDQTIANSIFQMLNYLNVDLFATRFNYKLPLYVSPVPDSHALAVDAFSLNWNLLHAYAFPPAILIPSILAKIRQSRCRIVLIAPFWPQQPWFSELLQLEYQPQFVFHYFQEILIQSKGKFLHLNLPLLDLHTWEFSNNQSEIKSFQKMLQTLSQNQDQNLLKKSMTRNESYTLIGVIEGRLIWSLSPITVIADFLIYLFSEKKY